MRVNLYCAHVNESSLFNQYSTIAQHLQALDKHIGYTHHIQHNIGAATMGQVFDGFDAFLRCRFLSVDHVVHTEFLAHRQPVGGAINADNRPGSQHASFGGMKQPDGTQSQHDHSIARAESFTGL